MHPNPHPKPKPKPKPEPKPKPKPNPNQVTVATFDAFPASRYRLDQLAEAHAAYCAHLKACFDSRKAECGAAHKELVFIGSRQPPPQAVRSRL